jgi:hypothetical protein
LVRRLEADVARYCAKYGLALLEFSHCRRLAEQATAYPSYNSSRYLGPFSIVRNDLGSPI